MTKLVTSKSRVAPIKGETIPHLELMGAVVLARLINSVQSALLGTLKFNDTFCWVDLGHNKGAQRVRPESCARGSTTCQARTLELLSHRM